MLQPFLRVKSGHPSDVMVFDPGHCGLRHVHVAAYRSTPRTASAPGGAAAARSPHPTAGTQTAVRRWMPQPPPPEVCGCCSRLPPGTTSGSSTSTRTRQVPEPNDSPGPAPVPDPDSDDADPDPHPDHRLDPAPDSDGGPDRPSPTPWSFCVLMLAPYVPILAHKRRLPAHFMIRWSCRPSVCRARGSVRADVGAPSVGSRVGPVGVLPNSVGRVLEARFVPSSAGELDHRRAAALVLRAGAHAGDHSFCRLQVSGGRVQNLSHFVLLSDVSSDMHVINLGRHK